MHDAAMDVVEEALLKKRKDGDTKEVREMFTVAFILERELANITLEQPSRAILFRSAATLAMDCGQYVEAIVMAKGGLLDKDVPEMIAMELREVQANALGLLGRPLLSEVKWERGL